MTKAFIPTLFEEDAVSFRPVYSLFDELKQWPQYNRASCSADVGVHEDDEAVFVEASLPGLKADEIKVDLKEGVLYIQGEKKEEKKEGKTHRKRTSKYAYSVLLPQPVDDAGIKAEAKDGVLTVRLPKSRAAKPVKITVKGA